jgi:membrane associated rhomboid family serine protease
VTFTLALPPRRAALGLVHTAARSPATVAFALVLLITTILLRTSVHPEAIMREVSTNVANLSHDPIRVVVGSALVLDGGPWIAYAIVLALTMGLLERRIGTLRALAIFATGHIIATAITEGGVWLGIQLDMLPIAERSQIDVGVSYGLLALIGAAIVLLPRPWRRRAVVFTTVGVLLALALDPDMTSTGHVLSLAIGFAWWPYVRRLDARRRPVTRSETVRATATESSEPLAELSPVS